MFADNFLKGVAFGMALVAGLKMLGWIGTADAEDAAVQAAHTCQMIEAGYWPAQVGPWCEGTDDQQEQ